MFVNSLFAVLLALVLFALVRAALANLRAPDGRPFLLQPHVSPPRDPGAQASPQATEPPGNALQDGTPADAPGASAPPPATHPVAPSHVVSRPERLGDEVLHGGGERSSGDARLVALEREVRALREATQRTARTEAQRSAPAHRTVTSSTTPGEPTVADSSQPPTLHAPPHAPVHDALRDEIERSPLDVIARRRLQSELETWQRRGGDDDGLLAGIRHDLQAAMAEAGARQPPVHERDEVRPARQSLFESERPRSEADRLRADLALRERQIDELRSELSSLRAIASPTIPAVQRQGFGVATAPLAPARTTPVEIHREPSASRLTDPFDRVPRRDDLKVINGIGKRMERMLNEFGVTTLAQLAAFEQHHIAQVTRRLDGARDDIEAEDWVGQARRILERRRERYESSGPA